MEQFIPPKLNPFVLKTVDALAPILMKIMHNIEKIIISDEDKAMLKTLKKERLIFLSNHPSTAEPPIAYLIANIIEDRFKYMGSRQVFEWMRGFVGKFIQSIGAFSVVAGTTDRPSIKMARSIIAQESGKLAIFPEGEPTSGENENLMPFQPGIVQLAYWGLEDARKVDPNADIVILPAFIKYVIKSPREKILFRLHKSIAKIEKKIGINPGKKNLLRRFLTAGRVLLEQAENEYRIIPKDKKDFNYRIGRVRHHILDTVAEKLQIQNYDKEAHAITKWRQVFPIVEMLEVGIMDPKLPNLSKEDLHWAKNECIKTYDFSIIKRDNLMEHPTPERFFEWLDRYESIVYKRKPRMLGGVPSHLPRDAYVFFAKPFKLSEYLPSNKSEKKTMFDSLLARLRSDIEEQLQKASKLTTPLVTPNDIGD
ncbi:MAG: 1-acyl-sn-glycerol-3-phosphate acyltransferase [Leptospiraceae bacterium]|nr:1-acyl-sn-glycerol-3-phosphate acyltransferase [Leptospiraceae bacterium]MCP5493022.1 1-acyl-sn-glycerol-3-phosphate acyltransferase [Leptospiraceae bacterium]